MNEETITLYAIYEIDNTIVMQSARYAIDPIKNLLMLYYDGGNRKSRLPGYLYVNQLEGHQRVAKTPSDAVEKFVNHQEAMIELARNLIKSPVQDGQPVLSN